jgi:hypothetical protein
MSGVQYKAMVKINGKKKMSAKSKGDKYEREVFRYLTNSGYTVELAHRTMRRIFVKGKVLFVSQRNDFFGLFDLFALSPSLPMEWVQVKSDTSDVYKAKKKISAWVQKFKRFDDAVQVWQRVARKGFIVHIYCPSDDSWFKTEILFKKNREKFK